MPSIEDKKHVTLYKKYRLTTPEFLVQKLIDWTLHADRPEVVLDTVVDLGCGSGQHTLALAPHARHVFAFDVSDQQISEARRHPAPANVSYAVAPADQLPLTDQSVQLVTGNLSFHWFDLDRVYADVDRVLLPGGVVAATGYIAMPTVVHSDKGAEINRLILDFEIEHFKGEHHVPSQRSLFYVNHYTELPLPYDEQLRLQNIPYVVQGSLHDLSGILCARGSFQRQFKEDPSKMIAALERFRKNICRVLSLSDDASPDSVSLAYHYEYFLAMCRKPTASANYETTNAL